MSETKHLTSNAQPSRRVLIQTMSAAGAAVLAPSWLAGQTAAEPPSTVSTRRATSAPMRRPSPTPIPIS